jgi:isopenicillin-N epimerase
MATMRQKLVSIIPISQQSATARRILSTNAGYKSIGSFHSDNVEDLMRLSDVDYNIPDLPFKQEEFILPTLSTPSVPFSDSRKFIECYTHLDRSQFSFVNHGAFGLALDVGLSRAHSWRVFLESQPLRYFDRYLLNHLAHSARCLVDFVAREKKDKIRESIALISNVTSGMNAVIGGHARCNKNNGNKVFYFDIGYGSNKKMCQTYHGENAIEIPFEQDFLPLLQSIPPHSTRSREENDSHPQAANAFLSAFDTAVCKLINEGKHSKSSLAGSLLILDHITSNTAIHTPILSLAKYAREEYGMVSVVDGAHSLLSLPLDIPNILSDGSDGQEGIDIYLTNCHKWFSAPRGAAALFCSNTHIQETILRQPAVVSHGVNDGFMSRFVWDGCRDYAAELSIPAITNFWRHVGVANVQEEMYKNLKEGVRILIQHWHPGVCSNGGDDADLSCIEQYSAEAGLTLVCLTLHSSYQNIYQGVEMRRKPLQMPKEYKITFTAAKLKCLSNV